MSNQIWSPLSLQITVKKHNAEVKQKWHFVKMLSSHCFWYFAVCILLWVFSSAGVKSRLCSFGQMTQLGDLSQWQNVSSKHNFCAVWLEGSVIWAKAHFTGTEWNCHFISSPISDMFVCMPVSGRTRFPVLWAVSSTDTLKRYLY